MRPKPTELVWLKLGLMLGRPRPGEVCPPKLGVVGDSDCCCGSGVLKRTSGGGDDAVAPADATRAGSWDSTRGWPVLLGSSTVGGGVSRESMRPISSIAPDNKSLKSCSVPDDLSAGRVGDGGRELESGLSERGIVDARGGDDSRPGPCGDAIGVWGVLIMVGSVCVLKACGCWGGGGVAVGCDGVSAPGVTAIGDSTTASGGVGVNLVSVSCLAHLWYSLFAPLAARRRLWAATFEYRILFRRRELRCNSSRVGRSHLH